MDQDRKRRLAEIAAIAVRLERETGVPAALLVAQWAVESAWGARPIGAANYFGIKKSARHARSCRVQTAEHIGGKRIEICAEFADYNSLEDAARDYAWLISNGWPYREAWKQYLATRDFDGLAAAIARVYATDPQYGLLIRTVAKQDNVRAAIETARAEAAA
jgi:flagellum-specific peptidoglycan hydrolase FlgJ